MVFNLLDALGNNMGVYISVVLLLLWHINSWILRKSQFYFLIGASQNTLPQLKALFYSSLYQMAKPLLSHESILIFSLRLLTKIKTSSLWKGSIVDGILTDQSLSHWEAWVKIQPPVGLSIWWRREEKTFLLSDYSSSNLLRAGYNR